MSLPRIYTTLFCLIFSLSFAIKASGARDQPVPVFDTTGRFQTDTTVIRFDYKQSALYYAYTFASIDSIVDIMKKVPAVTLTIDGYAFKDEGTDTICYWISYNRALFLQTYILGRGIDSARILKVNAFGNRSTVFKRIDKDGLDIHCRAELLVNYPLPPKKVILSDRDEDGIVDVEDKCPDDFGHLDKQGCPDSLMVVVPFPVDESALYSRTYKVLDSVLSVLKENPNYTIEISGHACVEEGIDAVAFNLGDERSDMVRQYLLSRFLNGTRITGTKNYGNTRPLNARKTPLDIISNARAEIIFTYH